MYMYMYMQLHCMYVTVTNFHAYSLCPQSLAAQWISQLLDLCKDRSPTPNTKILKNLCSFACADPQHTPAVRAASGHNTAPASKKRAKPKKGSPVPTSEEASPNMERGGDLWAWDSGIITLVRQQKEVHVHDIVHTCTCTCCKEVHVHTCTCTCCKEVHVHVHTCTCCTCLWIESFSVTKLHVHIHVHVVCRVYSFVSHTYPVHVHNLLCSWICSCLLTGYLMGVAGPPQPSETLWQQLPLNRRT